MEVATSSMSEPSGSTSVENLLDWQLTKTKLTERFQFICNTERYADVHFIVGEERQRIPAHKLVLSVGSPVFDAMFSRNWDSASSEVQVEEMEPSTFLTLLQFFYYDHIDITAENAIYVLNAAKRYAVPILEQHCIKFLVQNLDASNAFSILMQATFFDLPELKDKCLKMIDLKAIKAVAAEGFLNIDFDMLCNVLKRDTLRIWEYDLFQAAVRWASAECIKKNLEVNSTNQRSVLKEALYLIRFPSMSSEELTSGVLESGLLSDKELNALLVYYISKKKLSDCFSEQPRLTPYFTVNRFTDIDGVFSCDGRRHYLGFEADHDVQLLGVKMYGSSDRSASYTVTLRTKVLSNCAGLESSTKSSLCCKYSWDKTFELLFENPVKITKNVKYFFSFQITGPDSFRGVNGVNKVSVDIPGTVNERVTITFLLVVGGDGLMTTFEAGQLPELLFSL